MTQQPYPRLPTVKEKIGIPIDQEVTPEPVSMIKPTSHPALIMDQKEDDKKSNRSKKILFFLPGLFFTLLTLGNGCATTDASLSMKSESITSTVTTTDDQEVTSTTIPYTYYVSETIAGNPNFCDGANMDSAGYKATLTKKVRVIVSGTLPRDLTNQDKIKNTLQLAADAEQFGAVYTRIASTTFENHNYTVIMHPASGWAGSSIFFCKWKPFVEKNTEQFPEVTEIRWEPVN